MFKIVICGSLKNINEIKKISDKIYAYLSNPDELCITLPNLCQTRYAAQLECVEKLADADMVLIIPKDVKWDNLLYSEQKIIYIRGVYIPIGVHSYNYHLHEGIIIGESTSYEMAIARYFNKPINIVTDSEYINKRLS